MKIAKAKDLVYRIGWDKFVFVWLSLKAEVNDMPYLVAKALEGSVAGHIRDGETY